MTKDDHDQALRQLLLDLLKSGNAHVKFDEVVKDFPEGLRGKKLPGQPHTAWRLLEHMRIAQWDIVEFSRSSKHVSPEFPDGYWPEGDAPPSAAAWEKSVKQFRADLKAMQDLIADPKADLYARISWGDGQTVLREALLVADHNAYHLGELLMIRRLLGAWK
ncbi:MAG TPA: DinB family protein [Terriglobales bacterium]|nr:DinB family protein [Terriglobales bacterium]